MALTVDATAHLVNASFADPANWTHACAADATLCIVMVSITGGAPSVSSATYNSAAGSFVAGATETSHNFERSELWVKTSPSSGSNTISMDLTGTPGGGHGYSISF